MRQISIGGKPVGEGNPVYVVAEIGINHNGSVEIAKQLIEGAAGAGCDAVKFQKREPEKCVPRDEWDIMRDTPWGRMRYFEARQRMEFTADQYRDIDAYCKEKHIHWFASCWDEESVRFMEQFDTPAYKIPSASLTDDPLLAATRATGKPIILSTGMSTMEEIRKAVQTLGTENMLLAHATSTYPCPVEELNLNMIRTLQEEYPMLPIGYSGHEVGLSTTWAAVVLGASFVERHITLNRAMWGSDQAASIEVVGVQRLVSNIRTIEKALGDGVKKVYDSELPARKKLRRK